MFGFNIFILNSFLFDLFNKSSVQPSMMACKVKDTSKPNPSLRQHTLQLIGGIIESVASAAR